MFRRIALRVLSSTPNWNEREALGATEADQEPMLRRACLVLLHGRASASGRRFLRDVRTDPNFPLHRALGGGGVSNISQQRNRLSARRLVSIGALRRPVAA